MAITRKTDNKWLRAATLDHPGFLPGMPWECAPHAFERLAGLGFVEKRSFIRYDGNESFRAVATAKGIEKIAKLGDLFIAMQLKLKQAGAPAQ